MKDLIQDHPDFKSLKETINKGGILYKMKERYDPVKGLCDEKGYLIKPVAIFEVYGGMYLGKDRLTGYEVIKIKTMNGGMIGGNPIPPGEKYPSDEDIGKTGLSFHGKDFKTRAWDYYNKLKEEFDGKVSCSNI